MSLLSFHRVLILVAIAFCLGFSGWELRAARSFDGGPAALLLAAVFAILAAGLTIYLIRLRSILQLED